MNSNKRELERLRAKVVALVDHAMMPQRPPVSDSRQLLDVLEALFELAAGFAKQTGTTKIADLVRAPLELLRGYVVSGQIGAQVESQCRGRLVVIGGRVLRQSTPAAKVCAALAEIMDLEESLRQCLQIDEWDRAVPNAT